MLGETLSILARKKGKTPILFPSSKVRTSSPTWGQKAKKVATALCLPSVAVLCFRTSAVAMSLVVDVRRLPEAVLRFRASVAEVSLVVDVRHLPEAVLCFRALVAEVSAAVDVRRQLR
jgi:hypothetical protein